jgi:hypothetical protein
VADFDAIRVFYEKAQQRGTQIDHIIPLQNKLVCGLHVHTKMQLLTKHDNMVKGDRFNPAEHE